MKERFKMKKILICLIVFFLAASAVDAANLVLSPSIINVNIYSGENKTAYMRLTSSSSGYVHVYSNVTKNTSNLDGFNMTYPKSFNVDGKHVVTIPVSLWLDEKFGPNNITIKFWAVQVISTGVGGGGINISTEEHKNETISPPHPSTSNGTNGTAIKPPTKETAEPWYKEPWYWFWIIITIIIIALIIAYIIWKRKQEIDAESEELNEEKREVKQK